MYIHTYIRPSIGIRTLGCQAVRYLYLDSCHAESPRSQSQTLKAESLLLLFFILPLPRPRQFSLLGKKRRALLESRPSAGADNDNIVFFLTLLMPNEFRRGRLYGKVSMQCIAYLFVREKQEQVALGLFESYLGKRRNQT
jgi:hypothetical protein